VFNVCERVGKYAGMFASGESVESGSLREVFVWQRLLVDGFSTGYLRCGWS
jgi:hypothetical protein